MQEIKYQEMKKGSFEKTTKKKTKKKKEKKRKGKTFQISSRENIKKTFYLDIKISFFYKNVGMAGWANPNFSWSGKTKRVVGKGFASCET